MINKLMTLILFCGMVLLSGCALDGGGTDGPDMNEGGISGSGGAVDDNEGGISGSGGVPALPNLDILDLGATPVEFEKKLKIQKSWNQKSTTKDNFNYARSYFDSIEIKLFADLRDVADLLAGAYSVEPSEVAEHEFHWSYEVLLKNVVYAVDLKSIVKKKNVEWVLMVESNAVEQVLLSGTSSFAGDTGAWEVRKLGSDNTSPSVLIAWEELEAASEFKSYYSIVGELNENVNDSAEFTLTGDQAILSYFDHSIENVTEIKWDTVIESGSVTDPLFKDGQESFWDKNKYDLEIDPDAF